MDQQVWRDLTLSSQPAATAVVVEPQLLGLSRHEVLALLHNKGTISKAAQSGDQRIIIPQQEHLKSTSDHLKSKLGSYCACSSTKRDCSTSNERPGDRNKKRLMNNRESAARSRARKEAYTYELEAEIERLRVENAKLLKQQQKLLVASLGDHHHPSQEKHKLCRTLTAPF